MATETRPGLVRGIVLAAGASSRFGSHKLLHKPADGTPLGLAAVNAVRGALGHAIIVVDVADDALVSLFAGLDNVQVVICDARPRSMSESIACGIVAATDATGWLIALGDMPYIRPETIKRVAARIEQGAAIAAPVYRGQRGHPVAFADKYRSRLIGLHGDVGARSIIEDESQHISLVECDDPGILMDVDTPQDLRSI